MGNIIENSILSYYIGGYKGLIPHPALISRHYILGVSKETWKKRRTALRPNINRNHQGPKNRNRGRQVEVVREEEEPVEIQQPQPEDEAPELPQGQRSVSPILTFSLEVRQVQPEQGESSEPLSSSAAMLTLL